MAERYLLTSTTTYTLLRNTLMYVHGEVAGTGDGSMKIGEKVGLFLSEAGIFMRIGMDY